MPPVHQRDDLTPPQSSTTALRKGAACLQCRKRKMRCDAGQPQCANCVKGKKDCQYAAGRAKTKTQLLREKITDLETKIRLLEQQSNSRHGSTSTDSSSNSSSPPQDIDDGESPSPRSVRRASAGAVHREKSNSLAIQDTNGRRLTSSEFDFYIPEAFSLSSSLSPNIEAIPQLNWWETNEDPPLEIRNHLIDIFLSRPGKIFDFFLSRERFLASLELLPPDCPHPALMNAVYLMGCHFSRDPEYTQREPLFLARAREYLLTSLAHSDRLFDFLVSSGLIAFYLYRTGRFLEGHHQTAGAARFAVSCGLHQILSPAFDSNASESLRGVRASAPWSVSDMSVRRPGSMLTPPRDGTELGMRILVFWTTYFLDKLGAAVTALPGSLPDEADPLTEIQTVWPRTIEEYQTGDVSDLDYATIRNLYDPAFIAVNKRRPETLMGLQVQATALHERALRLAASYPSSGKSPVARENFWKTFTMVHSAIARFQADLPPLRNTGSMGQIFGNGTSLINPTIFLVYTLVHLAYIQLHSCLVQESVPSYDQCLSSTREVLGLAMLLGPIDYDLMSMEVIYSYAWTTCCQVLIRHQRTLVTQGNFQESASVNIELDMLVQCMTNLRPNFPVVDFQLGKIADWRSSMH
ncbi:hypothetical protein FRC03_011191 [Tulasnella sp. 419]|nr:hypothetical protein FRC03_011191 [Tulasnella sp. 419]